MCERPLYKGKTTSLVTYKHDIEHYVKPELGNNSEVLPTGGRGLIELLGSPDYAHAIIFLATAFDQSDEHVSTVQREEDESISIDTLTIE